MGCNEADAVSARTIKVSDEKSVRDRDKDITNREVSLDMALRDIMSTPLGRSWVWSLLDKSHVHGNAMRADDRQTAFACGEQNVGIQVLLQIHQVCPDLYAQAMKEASDDPRGK